MYRSNADHYPTGHKGVISFSPLNDALFKRGVFLESDFRQFRPGDL